MFIIFYFYWNLLWTIGFVRQGTTPGSGSIVSLVDTIIVAGDTAATGLYRTNIIRYLMPVSNWRECRTCLCWALDESHRRFLLFAITWLLCFRCEHNGSYLWDICWPLWHTFTAMTELANKTTNFGDTFHTYLSATTTFCGEMAPFSCYLFGILFLYFYTKYAIWGSWTQWTDEPKSERINMPIHWCCRRKCSL